MIFDVFNAVSNQFDRVEVYLSSRTVNVIARNVEHEYAQFMGWTKNGYEVFHA